MPSARKAATHLARRLIITCAATTLLAASAAACASSPAAPHAPVSLAQRHAISRFYLRKP